MIEGVTIAQIVEGISVSDIPRWFLEVAVIVLGSLSFYLLMREPKRIEGKITELTEKIDNFIEDYYRTKNNIEIRITKIETVCNERTNSEYAHFRHPDFKGGC